MSEKNLEMMRRLIESKKNKTPTQGPLRPSKTLSPDQRERKAIRSRKQGGLFD